MLFELIRYFGGEYSRQRSLRPTLAESKTAKMGHLSTPHNEMPCADYLTLLAEHGVQPSMSRVGNPCENAKAESSSRYSNRSRYMAESGAIWTPCAPNYDVFRKHLQPSATAFGAELSNSSRFRTTVADRGQPRGFYRDDWGEGANRPLAPDPTPRFTIFAPTKLSLASLSHVRGAVQYRCQGSVQYCEQNTVRVLNAV